MDLSRLSDKDLQELSRGNLAGMSEAGFATLVVAQERAMPFQDKAARMRARVTAEVNPVNDMSGPQRFAAGIGKAAFDVGRAVKQAAGGLTREQVDEIKRLDAPLMATPGGRAGYVTGVGGLGLLSQALPGAGSVLGSTLYGGAIGALSPLGTGDSLQQNVALGALGGGGSALAVNRTKAALAPNIAPSARSLMDQGVPLTPGQQLGGLWRRIEEGATSLPVTGDAIRQAQLRATVGMNAAVANRALAPIGAKLPEGLQGREAVAFVENTLGRVYDAALSRMGAVKADPAFTQELSSLRQMVRGGALPDDVKRQFDSVIKSQVDSKLQGQRAMTAQTWKQADSELGRLAARYSADASADKQMLGDALLEAQAAMRRWAQRAAPSDVSQDLSAANQGWAQFKRMQRAASAQTARDGVFSAEQYAAAVRALDKSKDHGAIARGNALGLDFADDAIATLGRTVPDSGTPFRTLVSQPVSGSVSGLLTSPVWAAYSSPRVLSAIQTAVSGRRPALATKAAAELEAMSPLLRALGVTYGAAIPATGSQ